MSTTEVTLFLALLAVGAQLTVLTAVVLAIAARVSTSGRVLAQRARELVSQDALHLAALVALVATLGSLYLSEIADFVPCKLCWYQRIAMYPLVPLLGLAAWRRDFAVRRYAAVIAAIGGTISIYHVLIERFPSLESGACDPTSPCSLIWVERFGYLTIPTMALSAFALILVLLAAAPSRRDLG